MHFKRLALIGLVCISVSLIGCTTENKDTQVEEPTVIEEVEDSVVEVEPEIIVEPTEVEPEIEEINLQEVKPNENW